MILFGGFWISQRDLHFNVCAGSIFVVLDGVAPEVNSHIVPFLSMRLPEYVTVEDPSLEVLNLLRIVHALNRHWGFLFQLVDYKPILSNNKPVNSKLTAKANRQLQVE